MTSTTSHPKKSRSSNTEPNRDGANGAERHRLPKAARSAAPAGAGNQRIAARRSYVSARSSLLHGAEPAGAAARRQRRRAGLPKPIPMAKIHPSLRELPRLERETYLTPYMIADQICLEARYLARSDVPMGYGTWLVRRTRQLYALNHGFNRRLRSDSGLGWLRTFLRHWITARLKREHPRLARLVPDSFGMGIAPQ